jgi:hypothetical protein
LAALAFFAFFAITTLHVGVGESGFYRFEARLISPLDRLCTAESKGFSGGIRPEALPVPKANAGLACVAFRIGLISSFEPRCSADTSGFS